jgi:hypothetical protein
MPPLCFPDASLLLPRLLPFASPDSGDPKRTQRGPKGEKPKLKTGFVCYGDHYKMCITKIWSDLTESANIMAFSVKLQAAFEEIGVHPV